jgi:hypothetical protein
VRFVIKEKECKISLTALRGTCITCQTNFVIYASKFDVHSSARVSPFEAYCSFIKIYEYIQIHNTENGPLSLACKLLKQSSRFSLLDFRDNDSNKNSHCASTLLCLNDWFFCGKVYHGVKYKRISLVKRTHKDQVMRSCQSSVNKFRELRLGMRETSHKSILLSLARIFHGCVGIRSITFLILLTHCHSISNQ